MTTDELRAKFENWWLRNGDPFDMHKITAWETWQAAHASRDAEVEALRRDAARYRFLRDMQCNHFYLTRDSDHAPNYMTAADWIEQEDQGYFDDVPADELRLMKETNTIWCLQVYPHTPIGFWHTCGATLDAAIDAAIAGTADVAGADEAC